MKKVYKVAGHSFCVEMPDSEALWERMGQYEPFISEEEDNLLFSLRLSESFDEEGFVSIFKDNPAEDQPPVEILKGGDEWLVKSCCHIKASADWKTAEFCFAHKDRLFCLNNALMILYAFCSAKYGTLEMHASVIACQGRGFLFLAPSGTGKSTHSQMWLSSIPGSELLNDDNPIVRIHPDGEVWVYGSPWSGKTPCYRNMAVPVGAFVRIRRAPFNKCSRTSVIESYANIYSSCSGFKASREMGDAIHSTLNSIATTVPCFTMECLPDGAAAIECADKVL